MNALVYPIAITANFRRVTRHSDFRFGPPQAVLGLGGRGRWRGFYGVYISQSAIIYSTEKNSFKFLIGDFIWNFQVPHFNLQSVKFSQQHKISLTLSSKNSWARFHNFLLCNIFIIIRCRTIHAQLNSGYSQVEFLSRDINNSFDRSSTR